VPDHRRDPDGAAPAAVLTALVVVALALRPQLAGIGPLSGRIIDDLGVSHAFVGLLTTIPILCMGLFAPLGPVIAGRLGARPAIALAAGTVGVAGLVRALAPGEPTLLVFTLVIGIATATSGPMLAMYVRGVIDDHRVAGTAAYAGGTTLGAAVTAGIVVPLAVVLGGWRASLALVSAASAVGVGVWLSLTASKPEHALAGDGAAARVRLPVRRPVVWALGLLFGIQSAVFYGVNAWLPSFYVERGWEPALAADLLAVSSLAGLVSIVVAPLASRRGLERRQLLAAAAASATVGLGGVILAPALAWVWVIVLGAGLGLTFTVVLTLPTDVAADAGEAGGASALMLLVGYLISSVAPFTLGAARDATGSFAVSLWLLFLLAASMLPLSWALAPEHLRPRSATASLGARRGSG
jgi:CP family cyanate transporter-like MFS transporter